MSKYVLVKTRRGVIGCAGSEAQAMELGTAVTGSITAEQQDAVLAVLRQRDVSARQRERLEMVKAAWLGVDVATMRGGGATPRSWRPGPTVAYPVGGYPDPPHRPRPGAP